MDGVLVVDKPAGMTSHDVVNRLRRLLGTRKIGHLGTLDPMATGVLPALIGRATRLAQFFGGSEKIYEATFRLGIETDTYDREGVSLREFPVPELSLEDLDRRLDRFRGSFEQVPPPVSAKKIGGIPAYKLARRDVPFELKPVAVRVHSLELLGCDGPLLRVIIHCSPGTYVRSIAHGLGRDLGCGAIVESLRRTRSGDFDLAQAYTLDRLAGMASDETLPQAILPAAELLPGFPLERVDAVTELQIRQGRDFRVSPFRQRGECRYVRAISEAGELIAIGEAKLPHLYHPVLVL